jgi:hypothetical protein
VFLQHEDSQETHLGGEGSCVEVIHIRPCTFRSSWIVLGRRIFFFPTKRGRIARADRDAFRHIERASRTDPAWTNAPRAGWRCGAPQPLITKLPSTLLPASDPKPHESHARPDLTQGSSRNHSLSAQLRKRIIPGASPHQSGTALLSRHRSTPVGLTLTPAHIPKRQVSN